MVKNSKIYIAGHRGMVGSAVHIQLLEDGYKNIITKELDELNLVNQQEVNSFFKQYKPDFVIIAAAVVGGIMANSTQPWKFLYENLMIEANLINAAQENNIQNLIFLGSSCIYPKLAPQPLKEEYLLTGPLEPTNEWYAIAKIAGIKLCQALNQQFGRNYISLMPTNLYGKRDNFDLISSHVLPAMIRKFHEAKINNNATVTLWGSGTPMREFLNVEDLAKAITFVTQNIENIKIDLLNVGTGTDVTIKELASIVQKVVGHTGEIQWDSTKPDGTPRKLMDVSRIIELGWKPQIELSEGIKIAYDWYISNCTNKN